MAKVGIENLGGIGLVGDLEPQELPLAGFTQLLNFRVAPDGVHSVYSHSLALPYVAENASLGIHYTEVAGVPIWVSLSNSRIRASNSTTSAQIVNAGISSLSLATKWNSCYLSGFSIFNNGQNIPWAWAGSITAASAITLTNWPATARCRVMRSFKEYLIALDINDDGTLYPTMVWWSHPAEPGTLPETWDFTDEERDAGRTELSELPGPVVDALPLGDSLIVYKTDSVWGAAFVGAPYIFRFYKITEAFGCITPNGVVAYPGGHCVLTKSDVVVHNGGGDPNSILTYRYRRELFRALRPATFDFAFLVTVPEFNEVWICYPFEQTGGAETRSSCNRAICWNWLTNSLYMRTLPNVHAGNVGQVITSAVVPHTTDTLVMVTHDEADDFLWMDRWDADVNIPAGIIEREDLGIIGRRYDGSPRYDSTTRKIFTSFYPRLTYTGSPVVSLSFGGRNRPSENVSYPIVKTFTKTRLRQSFILNKVLLSYKINVTYTNGANEVVSFHGYEYEVATAGENW